MMKPIYSYITEKLHVGKGMQPDYVSTLESLKEDIIRILKDSFGLLPENYRLYYCDGEGNITDERKKYTTQFTIYINAKIQNNEWKGDNEKNHKEIAKKILDSNLPDIKDVKITEHKYINGKLKIQIHIKRGS